MIYFDILIIAFLLNFLWEVWHCNLYKTIHKMSLGPVIRLLTKMSLKDGLWVVLFYFITVIVFGNINILENYTQLGLFIIISLTFSFIDEKVSLKMGRWSYAKNMPTIFGVGITPLLEVAVTGVLAFAIVFLI